MKQKNKLGVLQRMFLKDGNHFLIALGICLSVMACQDVKRPQIPANLITQDAMVLVLVDAYTINAARSIDNRIIVNNGVLLDSILYSKHGIDSLQFVQSNAYYASDLEAYKKIFLKVEAQLQLEKIKKDTLYAKYKKDKEQQRIKDSIKGAKLDSLHRLYPKINRDSIKGLLKLLVTIKDTTGIKKTSIQ